MITFKADARYGCSGQYVARITGRDSKFTFNREFMGRKSGKRNDVTEADTDEPGLYEVCDVTSKGKDSTYYVVLHNGKNLCSFVCDKSDAMKLAKELDSRSWDDIVAYVPGYDSLIKKIKATEAAMSQEENKDQEEVITLTSAVYTMPIGTSITRKALREFRQSNIDRLTKEIAEAKLSGVAETTGWEFRTVKAAAKVNEAVTVATALESCWAILQALPEKQAREVLKQLKLKVSPPTEKTETPSSTESEISAVQPENAVESQPNAHQN